MATVIRSAKGCVYTVNRGGKMGFYSLRPMLRGQEGSPILIEGVDGGESDATFQVATLDSKKFIYVFGDDFGDVRITGMALLGKSETGGQAFNQVKDYFKTHRISASKTPIVVSLPGSATMRVYLTRFVIARPDAQFHAQPFFFQGVSVEPKKA